MATITPATVIASKKEGTVYRYYGASADNSADTLTTPAITGKAHRLANVTIAYTGSSTYTATGLTITIDSALGATYDTVIFTGSVDNATSVHFVAGDQVVPLLPGDAIKVTVPAGGSGKVASIQVNIETM